MSLTFVIPKNYGAENTKIYGLNFIGVRTNKKKQIMLGLFELSPLGDALDQKETKVNQDLIYG